MKDMSMLHPLSVRDLIWVEVERGIVAEQEAKAEFDRSKYLHDRFDRIEMFLADIKHVSLLTEYGVRLNLMKGGKGIRTIKPIATKSLPSTAMAQEKEDRELTPEQKAAKNIAERKRLLRAAQRRREQKYIDQLLADADTPEKLAEAERLFNEFQQKQSEEQHNNNDEDSETS